MRIYPAVHYTMGGLWVDYNLMSTIPGLHVIGEANFSDHGANRLGASALMQGLADGYFILPSTDRRLPRLGEAGAGRRDACRSSRRVEAEVARADAAAAGRSRGKRTVDSFHRELGQLMWDKCGMARNAAGLQEALQRIPELREEFWRNVNVPGSDAELNQALEKAGRVADFLELGELMCRDALHREESCGGHFREEYQTEDGEALRDDEHFAYVAAWEYTGDLAAPRLNQEPLDVRVRAPGAAELQVAGDPLTEIDEPHAPRLAPTRPGAAGPHGAVRARTTSARTCRSSRCWTWSTSA